MGRSEKEMRITRLVRAMGLALVVCGLGPVSATAQSAGTPKQSQVRQDAGGDAVTCMAGCGGQSGQVLARPQLPPEAPEKPSGWRPIGQNNWCHEKLGCRTQYPEESSSRPRSSYSGGGCYSFGGEYVCY